MQLLATMRRNIYQRIKLLRDNDGYSLDAARDIKREESLALRESWRVLVRSEGGFGRYTREIIGPVFDLWLDRSHGFVSFHTTQFLTGHGCFMAFLHRIGKKAKPTCFYCEADDTALHTLLECQQWNAERNTLREGLSDLRGGFALTNIVSAILRVPENWKRFATFAEKVLRSKEEEECRREREGIG